MISTNKFSMTYVQIITKDIKKTGEYVIPQVYPGMQSDRVFIVSYIIVGQSSPVDILRSIIRACEKLVKFIYTGSIIFPWVMF